MKTNQTKAFFIMVKLFRSSLTTVSLDSTLEKPKISKKFISIKQNLSLSKKAINSSQKSFIYRNLIKKIKTRCIKHYEKSISKCIINPQKFSFYNLEELNARTIFRFFKSDISKHKNRILLNTSMKTFLRKFIGKSNLINLNIKETHKHTFNMLNNITWKEFMCCLKYNIKTIIFLPLDKDNIVINKENFNIFFDYIDPTKEKYSYIKKKTWNKKYLHFIEQLEKDNTLINSNDINEIESNKSFQQFLFSFNTFET